MTNTTSSARRPRRDALENRAGIIAAATAAIAHDPRASLDVIARNAGLSRRALYGHFEDRDALIREILAAGAPRFNEIALDIHDADAPVALARLTARLWRKAAMVQVAAAIALDDAHVQETADFLAPIRRTVLDIVRRGQDAGTLRADIPAPTVARLIEETARTVVGHLDADSPDSAPLAVKAVLSIAGLSWRESVALLTRHPDILDIPATEKAA
ncbi:TetR/AcrR family transcriptional regulator [Microbacterium sp. ASV49]|uniref:TetR/AcrR family transcriptional regulator n=1 Tax=Microbacterium candidum TaxID=3041922 RepID=A0ABT7MUH6_9MICO|nr:TetR/AcrR family transcriptional regulator [Microbacterium sp. ASV49]MDL9978090.1 TetR/AcrR family transcriptional regulator [Microbacterium sp. ASV49]